MQQHTQNWGEGGSLHGDGLIEEVNSPFVAKELVEVGRVQAGEVNVLEEGVVGQVQSRVRVHGGKGGEGQRGEERVEGNRELRPLWGVLCHADGNEGRKGY